MRDSTVCQCAFFTSLEFHQRLRHSSLHHQTIANLAGRWESGENKSP